MPMGLGFADAQEGYAARLLHHRDLADAASELCQRQGPDGGLVDGLLAGRADPRQEGRGPLSRGLGCRGSGRWELLLPFAQKGDNLGVLGGGGIVGACEERQEAVAALQRRRDQAWGGVGFIALEAGAEEVADRMRPSGPREELVRKGDAWDLAQQSPVEREAWQ